MQGVNVFENGIGYLHKCLELYTSGTGFLLMYLFAVLVILIKGKKRERELFLPEAVVLLLTVFNPLVPLVLDLGELGGKVGKCPAGESAGMVRKDRAREYRAFHPAGGNER